jgi:hypothetical protein
MGRAIAQKRARIVGMSQACGIGFGLAAVAVWFAACAGAPPTIEAPAAPSASEPAQAVTLAPAETAPPSTASNPPAASAEPPPAPRAPSILAICAAKCDQLVPKCGGPAVESCRVNCTKYEPPPTGCGDQVRSALECARDAKDLTCANVAPESCAKKFRAIAACSAGETTEKPEQAPAGLPPGWEKVSDPANGFSLALPQGSTAKAGVDGPVRSVTGSDGTLYTVSVLPLLNEKPSEKSLLHFLMKVQGRCSDKVKLDGFIEKAPRYSIHFTAHCPDKTDWNGMIYINDKHLVMLSAQAPFGKIGPTEPFFYGFEFGS